MNALARLEAEREQFAAVAKVRDEALARKRREESAREEEEKLKQAATALAHLSQGAFIRGVIGPGQAMRHLIAEHGIASSAVPVAQTPLWRMFGVHGRFKIVRK